MSCWGWLLPKEWRAAFEKGRRWERSRRQASVYHSRLHLEEPTFHVEDTTLNVVPSSPGSMLTAVSDPSLQYLMAGARANMGLKSGCYMFEVKILEKGQRSVLRVGFATANSSLVLGEAEDTVCFDSEGYFLNGRKASPIFFKLTTGDVVTVVANLDPDSRFANTLSILKDGQHAAPPQAIPERLQGQVLYPAVSFRNMALHYNFGSSFVPTSLKCCFLKAALLQDVIIKPSDGRCEVDARSERRRLIELPDVARWHRWTFDAGVEPVAEYLHHCDAVNPTIELDIARTPGLNQRQQLSLKRVLNAYASFNPRIGYCQGMNFIVALMLRVSGSEEESFAFFVRLMDDEGFSGLYAGGFPLLLWLQGEFEKLFAERLPALHRHFSELGVVPALYLHQWLWTLFASAFPLTTVVLFWDRLFREGIKEMPWICIQILQVHQSELLKCKDLEGIMHILGNLKGDGDRDEGPNGATDSLVIAPHIAGVVSGSWLEWLGLEPFSGS